MTKKTQSPELMIYGRRAVIAAWEKRPKDIVRAYVTKERMNWISDILKWCAQQKKAYHIVTEAELEKVCHSVHHEGVALLTKKRPELEEAQWLKQPQTSSIILMLDGVANPHNLGAIARSMAHFGAPLLIGEKDELPPLSASWMRVSEGGCEFVDVLWVKDKLATLQHLKKSGYTIMALSSHVKESIYQTSIPKKVVFTLGNEISGLSEKVEKLANKVVRIPGTGAMESLNVSVTAAICLNEWYRGQQHG